MKMSSVMSQVKQHKRGDKSYDASVALTRETDYFSHIYDMKSLMLTLEIEVPAVHTLKQEPFNG